MGLSKRINKCIEDKRHASYVNHSQLSMLKQRIYSLALGHEDLNDQEQLRYDECLKIAAERKDALASTSTLSRLENTVTHDEIAALRGVLLEAFIESYKKAPKEVILDFDATDDQIHGNQERAFYNGYYEHHCFMPLYVFCGHHLLAAHLRPSNIDGAKHAWAILALIVKRLRVVWPHVEIIFRGDGGFCRDKMLNWCDRHNIKYIVGMAKNNRLMEAISKKCAEAEYQFTSTQEPVRLFDRFEYAADSWSHKRLMIAKIEYNRHGESVRFIATNLQGHSQKLYEDLYCQRGDMENRIKEQQLDLFADRTSCHQFTANYFRLLLSSFAYVLIQKLRMTLLKRSDLANAYVATIRNKLLKIGAVIIKNTRKIKILMDSHHPLQELFIAAIQKLHPS